VSPVSSLTRPQAKALDKRTRAVSDKLAGDIATLLGLLDDAEHGRIDVALGTSWSSWLADAARVHIDDRGERQRLVALLGGRTYRIANGGA
jgi:hypothetical protein